ncbi:MAG: hypothetical protein ACXABG_14900, partial [Promethearchaeota archaeon]
MGSLIKLLTNFIERKTSTFSISNRTNAELVHYYNEILRNWNKINYIFKRKLNSTKKLTITANFSIAKYFIAIYLIIWEKQDIMKVSADLNFSSATINHFKNLESFSWKKELSGKYETERLSLQLAVPSFMIKKLVVTMNTDSIRANINYMDRQSERTIFYFRINNLTFNKAQKNRSKLILAEFQEQG